MVSPTSKYQVERTKKSNKTTGVIALKQPHHSATEHWMPYGCLSTCNGFSAGPSFSSWLNIHLKHDPKHVPLAWPRLASTISTCGGYVPPSHIKIGTPQFSTHYLGKFGVLPARRLQLTLTLSNEDVQITLKLQRDGARSLILWPQKFPWLLCKFSCLFPKDSLCLPIAIVRGCPT